MSVVTVRDVSKRFRRYNERPRSLKEAIIHRRGFSYDELWALRDISLTIDRGSTYGLIGHNGSGKSTLLRLMAGIHQPTSGSIESTGRVAALLELGAGFHPELTGRENVFLNGAIMGLARKEIAAALDDIIAFSELEDFIDSPVKMYSSGMYLRLGFSVAVNIQPEVLLIDEILAVGDEQFQRKCMDHIYRLRNEGTTIVFVSHSMPAVQALCERVAWLDHGKLMHEGAAAPAIDHYIEQVNAQERVRLQHEDDEPDAPTGTGEIAISSVTFHDETGAQTPAAATGRPLTIRIGYQCREPVEEPVFGLAILHENGLNLAGPNSKFGGLEIGTVSGQGHVDFVLDRVPVLPGTYLLTVSIYDSHLLHPYDQREKAYTLHVQPGTSPERFGLMDMAGRWALQR